MGLRLWGGTGSNTGRDGGRGTCCGHCTGGCAGDCSGGVIGCVIGGLTGRVTPPQGDSSCPVKSPANPWPGPNHPWFARTSLTFTQLLFWALARVPTCLAFLPKVCFPANVAVLWNSLSTTAVCVKPAFRAIGEWRDEESEIADCPLRLALSVNALLVSSRA